MPTYSFDTNLPFAIKNRLTVTRLNRGWTNSMAIKQGDQALDQLRGAIQTTSISGVNNDFSLSTACVTLIWSGTLDATITGFSGGRSGRRIRVIHAGTTGKYLRISHNDSGSIIANRVFCASIIGQYIGANGVVDIEWTGSTWYATVIHPGLPIPVPYSAGSYAASGTGSPTWTFPTGATNITCHTMLQIGNILEVSFASSGGTMGGTTVTNLSYTLPFSAVAGQPESFLAGDLYLNNGAANAAGLLLTTVGSTLILIYRQDRGAFPISTANNAVSFKGRFQIQ